MQETSQVGWLLCWWSTICKSGQLKINLISNTSHPRARLAGVVAVPVVVPGPSPLGSAYCYISH